VRIGRRAPSQDPKKARHTHAAVETLTASVNCAPYNPLIYVLVSARLPTDNFVSKRADSENILLLLLKLPHFCNDRGQPHTVGVAHRASAMRGKPIPVSTHGSDIRCPLGNLLIEDPRPLVKSANMAIDDFFTRNRLSSQSKVPRMILDKSFNESIRAARAVAGS
jgi:hypothetical protein